MTDLSFDIPERAWVVADPEDADPLTRLTVTVALNGLSMFFEAWQVTVDEHDMQTTVDPGFADSFDRVHSATLANGPFQTTTINGREYVIVATPHCR